MIHRRSSCDYPHWLVPIDILDKSHSQILYYFSLRLPLYVIQSLSVACHISMRYYNIAWKPRAEMWRPRIFCFNCKLRYKISWDLPLTFSSFDSHKNQFIWWLVRISTGNEIVPVTYQVIPSKKFESLNSLQWHHSGKCTSLRLSIAHYWLVTVSG